MKSFGHYDFSNQSSLAVPAGSVEVETEVVSGEDPVEAGSGSLTLTCTVRETISGLTNMPSALWVGPSGPVEDGESVTLTGTTSDVTATLTLTFPSLLTSQAGEYTCQGTVVTPAGLDNITITYTPPRYVTVSCKYQRMELFVHDFDHLYHFLHPTSPISTSLYVSLSQCPPQIRL